MKRSEYAGIYGPTTGDRINLADTGLVIEVMQDSQEPGDEFLMGFGKSARDGMHLQAATVRETCDVVISNVVVLDAVLGSAQSLHRDSRRPNLRDRTSRQPAHARRR